MSTRSICFINMRTLIISPHLDDAIFSLGNFIQEMDDVTILTVFGGMPTDEEGFQKYRTLHWEHQKACEVLGVTYTNLDFLDDVYGLQDEAEILRVLKKAVQAIEPDEIYVPVGIHHPDHKLVNKIFSENFKIDYLYCELPYAVLYPMAETNYLMSIGQIMGRPHSQLKEKAVKCYQSQIQNDHILSELFVEEHVWKM